MAQSFRCNQCEFWEPIPVYGPNAGASYNGICRIGLAQIDLNDEGYKGRWPVTLLDEWCGPGLLCHQKKLRDEEAALASHIKE